MRYVCTSYPPLQRAGGLITSASSEGTTGRTLTGATFADGSAMTIQNCINFCNAQGAIYAGVEYSVRVILFSHFTSNLYLLDHKLNYLLPSFLVHQ